MSRRCVDRCGSLWIGLELFQVVPASGIKGGEGCTFIVLLSSQCGIFGLVLPIGYLLAEKPEIFSFVNSLTL
jgi:hypothetical protein